MPVLACWHSHCPREELQASCQLLTAAIRHQLHNRNVDQDDAIASRHSRPIVAVTRCPSRQQFPLTEDLSLATRSSGDAVKRETAGHAARGGRRPSDLVVRPF